MDLGEFEFASRHASHSALINKFHFSYVELGSDKEVDIALKLDRRMIAGRPVFISRCERDKTKRDTPFKYSTTIEPNKLFVKGVSYDATSEDLKELFGKYGTIQGVRIVTHK